MGHRTTSPNVKGFGHPSVQVQYDEDGSTTDVSHNCPLPVSLHVANTPAVDAFGRLRTSQPSTIFDSKQVINARPLFWDEALSGGASASTHSILRASSLMALGTTSGEKIIRQTKRYFNYQPGKSLSFVVTAIFEPKASVRQRVGYFDADNGLFFEHDGTTMKVVVRSKASGSVVDTVFNQADWDDPMLDGSGSSGRTVDWTKNHVLSIDFPWLGSGQVRFNIAFDGSPVPVHSIDFSDAATSVYMSTPDLPARYEIENTGTSASGTTLEQICTSVSSEGGYTPAGTVHGYAMGNGETSAFTNALTPIMSIRLSAAGIRAHVELIQVSMLLLTNIDTVYKVIHNPTITGGLGHSWAAADSNSVVEYDITKTGVVSAGTQIGGGYLTKAIDAGRELVKSDLHLAATIAGVSDIITIAAERAAGSGSVSAMAGMLWREVA